MNARNLILRSLPGAAIVLLLAATVALAQGLGARYSFDELEKMASDAELVLHVKAGAPTEVVDGERGLDYQIPCEVLQVVKGRLAAKEITLRLGSTATALQTMRREVAGKQYILPVVALEGHEGVYRLVDRAGFEADSAEGRKLVEIVSGEPERQIVTPLRMSVDPLGTPIEFGEPARIRIRLENPSDERAVYEQAPLEVRDGKLLISGGGLIRIVDSSGVEVTPKAGYVAGRDQTEALRPAVIDGGEALQIDVDLGEFFDFPREGIYGVNVALATPGGELLRNTVPLQLRSAADGRRGGPGRAALTGQSGDLVVPSPEVYVPGQPMNGLNMLLKPVKSEFRVGEPIEVEIRLTNIDEQGTRPIHVDVRLERCLMLQVTAQGDSPVVPPFVQRITWNDKTDEANAGRNEKTDTKVNQPVTWNEKSSEAGADQPVTRNEKRSEAGSDQPYAMLRTGSFWGKTVNMNSLHGVDTTELLVSRVDPNKLESSQISYERYGMTLFSFDKPGVYRIDATYFAQPRPEGRRVWAGKLTSNHIFIRVSPAIGGDERVER